METHFSTGNKLVFVLVWSLLCSGATQQELTKDPGVSRTYVCEGKDVVLPCSCRRSLENTVIMWKNKDKGVFFYRYGQDYDKGRSGQDEQYRGRVSLFYDELKKGNASMLLRNVRVEDRGTYTCELPRLDSGWQSSTMELIVDPGVPRMYVREGEDVVLHCSSGESLENTLIHWKNQRGKEVFFYEKGEHSESGRCCPDKQYKARGSLFYDELKKGNASVILRKTRVEDTGFYTCVLPYLSSGSQISTMELIVGAVQTPYLGVYKVTKAGVELQCVVRGSSSKPSVEWETCEGDSLKSSGQTVSDSRGRYKAKRFVTVTETENNCFRCVVQQEDVNHRTEREITVPEKIFEKTSSHSTWVLVGMWFAVIVLLLLAQHEVREARERASYRGRSRRSGESGGGTSATRWMMGVMIHVTQSVMKSLIPSEENVGNGVPTTQRLSTTVKTEEKEVKV